MSSIYIQESALIPATAKRVYDLLADYEHGHPKILPKPYFMSLEVEEGGQGAGTVFRADMNVMGSKSTMRMRVSEPQPGRVLAEQNIDNGTRTTFTAEPVENGTQTWLTIATEYQLSGGVAGLIERWMIPQLLKRIYKAEMGLIADYLQSETDQERVGLVAE